MKGAVLHSLSHQAAILEFGPGACLAWQKSGDKAQSGAHGGVWPWAAMALPTPLPFIISSPTAGGGPRAGGPPPPRFRRLSLLLHMVMSLSGGCHACLVIDRVFHRPPQPIKMQKLNGTSIAILKYFSASRVCSRELRDAVDAQHGLPAGASSHAAPAWRELVEHLSW